MSKLEEQIWVHVVRVVLRDGDCGRPECLQHGIVNVVRSYLSDGVGHTEMGEFEMTPGVGPRITPGKHFL